jgi:hypothetical protein
MFVYYIIIVNVSKDINTLKFQNTWIRYYHISKFMVKFKLFFILVSNHQFTIDTWCEQYIEFIINISHLRNKWLHMKIRHLVYI